jgi:osmotically-inducible protein OsmY
MGRHDDERSRRRRGGVGQGTLLDRIVRDVTSWFDREEAGEARDHAGDDWDEPRSGRGEARSSSRTGRYSGIGPKSYRPSPERLKELIAERLADDDTVNAAEIEIDVEGEEVTLTGKVPSREQKRLAEDCAESVRGVRDVHNRLTIDPTMQA